MRVVSRSIIVASLLLLVAACGENGKWQATPARPVSGEQWIVQSGPVKQSKPLAGEITTRKQAEALARIAGILVELKVHEGDEVTKGQLIGRVVETRLAYETSAYEAQIAAAVAQAENARADLERVKYLTDRGFYAKSRLDQAEAAYRSAMAQVQAARSQRSASAALAAEGAVLAPSSGRVLRADVPPGSAVTAGMSVATITAGPPVLRLDVPESLTNQLRLGATVTVQDESELNGRIGKIDQVYPAIAGGRIRADVDVPGLTAAFVGRRISVLLDVGSRPGITVPQRFVDNRFGLDYVELAASDGSATSVPVQTAPTNDPGQVELLSGVSNGDVLVAPRRAQ